MDVFDPMSFQPQTSYPHPHNGDAALPRPSSVSDLALSQFIESLRLNDNPHNGDAALPRPSSVSDLALLQFIESLRLNDNQRSPTPPSELRTQEEIEIRSDAEDEESIGNKELGEEENSIGDDSAGQGIANGETVEHDLEDDLDKKFNARKNIHPLRPEAEDCAFYLKTGNCKFGSNCKFNHPVRNKSNHHAAKERIKEKDKDKGKEKEEIPEKSGQSDCKFYLRSGGCKYGKKCKNNHPRTKPAPAVEFNFVGLPIRLAEKECPYYMRTGACKYGVHCRFHHPEPTDVAGGSETSIGYTI